MIMKKTGLLIVCLFTLLPLAAQKSPVGIVSVQDSVKGFQFGVFSSVAADGGYGVQLSGISNASARLFNGLQLSSTSNITAGMNQGLQLAGILNVSEGMMGGWQLGMVNYADSLDGAQIGVFNVARKRPRGWQVGLVNVSYDSIGHKIGLVNVSPRTRIDLMLYGGSSTKINGAMRYRNKSTYNIIGIGTHFMGLDSKFSGALFYRLGQYWQLSPKWSLSGDVGFYHVETFEKNSNNAPERLYSLQARVNADYQITERIGAFASVGWGLTRYYDRNETYRNRPLVELGVTLRQTRDKHDTWKRAWDKKRQSFVATDSTMALPVKKRYWQAAAEVTGINVGVHLFDRYVLKEEFSQTTLRTLKRNFTDGMVWDNDFFITNMFAHPYHGNLYFNAARTNGLTFWESAPYALGGSLMWEFLGETEPPAINDIIATSCGGMAIGEMTHRLSLAMLDDRTKGFPRFLREAAAAIVNPIQGLHRIISGDAWRVRSDHYRYHDYEESPIDASVALGWRYLADDGALFRGVHAPYVNVTLTYGTPVDGERHTTPYDFFDIESNIAFGGGQPAVNSLQIVGRLWSMPILDEKEMAGEFGIYQHFNYYDAKPIKDGSELTPYRISEAAGFGPGFIFSLPQIGALSRVEQRVFLSGILLGGTKSDYFNVIERDYNMGSGFSIKTKTQLDFGKFGRFLLNAKYFRLYTWKGYRQEDIATDFKNVEDLHYLNVQGDRSNAMLLVVNPVMEFHVAKQWSVNLSAAYYGRRTFYKYYDTVHAHTFETKIGITCRL
jgi:opacity protein-like surface antigen